MWPIYLLTLVNACFSRTGWSALFQIDAGGLSSNLVSTTFCAALGLTVLIRFFRKPSITVPVPKPATWLTWLYPLAFIIGLAGMVWGEHYLLSPKDVFIAVRDFFALFACIYMGYVLAVAPTSSKSFVRLMVLAAAVNAAFLLVRFASKTEDVQIIGDWKAVREFSIVTNYSGLGALLVLYSMATGMKIVPTWLGVALVALCTLGQLSVMNRSDWLAFGAGGASMVVLIPRDRRLRFLAISLIGGTITLGVVAAAVSITSKYTDKDLTTYMTKKLESLSPWGDYSSSDYRKAWETRLPSITNDLTILASNPLLGNGFGAQERIMIETGQNPGNFHHNAWTDITAKTGIAGLVAITLTIGGMGVAGRKLVQQSPDPSTRLIGALGVICAAYYAVLGAATMSFNSLQCAMILGCTAGVVLRTYAMHSQAQATQLASTVQSTESPAWA